MCSGKSTLGRALNRVTGMPFVDLDHYIEDEAGMSVKEIFAKLGEEVFRRMEWDALMRLAGMQDVIVACGGGTPCREGAMELMNASGTTVLLVPQAERLIRRLMMGRHKRPLIADITSHQQMVRFVEELSAKRMPYYSKAQYTFDTSLLETDCEIAITLDEFVRRFLSDK